MTAPNTAPERIWVDNRREDWSRDPRDKGTSSYIGDATDGPDSECVEYTRADLSGWRDIESDPPPKDGKPFTIYTHNPHHGWIIMSPISRDEAGGWWDDCTLEQIEPPEATHWQPHPAPPEAKP